MLQNKTIKIYEDFKYGKEIIREIDATVDNAYNIYNEIETHEHTIYSVPPFELEDLHWRFAKAKENFENLSTVIVNYTDDMECLILCDNRDIYFTRRHYADVNKINFFLNAYNYEMSGIVHNKKVQQAWLSKSGDLNIPNKTKHFRPVS